MWSCRCLVQLQYNIPDSIQNALSEGQRVKPDFAILSACGGTFMGLCSYTPRSLLQNPHGPHRKTQVCFML